MDEKKAERKTLKPCADDTEQDTARPVKIVI